MTVFVQKKCTKLLKKVGKYIKQGQVKEKANYGERHK